MDVCMHGDDAPATGLVWWIVVSARNAAWQSCLQLCIERRWQCGPILHKQSCNCSIWQEYDAKCNSEVSWRHSPMICRVSLASNVTSQSPSEISDLRYATRESLTRDVLQCSTQVKMQHYLNIISTWTPTCTNTQPCSCVWYQGKDLDKPIINRINQSSTG